MSLVAQDAQIRAEVIVRDKDGNIKYQGPLFMTPIVETANGDDASDRSTD